MIAKLQWPMKSVRNTSNTCKYGGGKTFLEVWQAKNNKHSAHIHQFIKPYLRENNKTGIFVYLFLLKTPLSSILGFMKFGLTITIIYE